MKYAAYFCIFISVFLVVKGIDERKNRRFEDYRTVSELLKASKGRIQDFLMPLGDIIKEFLSNEKTEDKDSPLIAGLRSYGKTGNIAVLADGINKSTGSSRKAKSK